MSRAASCSPSARPAARHPRPSRSTGSPHRTTRPPVSGRAGCASPATGAAGPNWCTVRSSPSNSSPTPPPAPSSRRPPWAFPSRSAENATGTTGSPGYATARCPCAPCWTSVSPRRPPPSSTGWSTGCRSARARRKSRSRRCTGSTATPTCPRRHSSTSRATAAPPRPHRQRSRRPAPAGHLR